VSRRLELNGVHVFEKIGPSQHAVTKIRPAMRLCQGEASLYIQAGTVFTPGGDPVASKDVPTWFLEELKKCSPAALDECGYKLPEVKPARKAAVAQAAAE